MKRLRLYLTTLASVLILASCGGDSEETDTGKTVFRYNEPGGISSLDPAFARNIENVWAMNQLYNGLVQMDSNLEVQPCIAKNWEVLDSGLTYRFHLRDDVYFHDHELFPDGKGRKVVAQDFVNSFYRIVNKEVGSPGAYILNGLDRTATTNNLGFYAEDEQTLVIHLQKPFPAFLGVLTMQYCSVVPQEIVDYYGLDFRRNPVGTGPFQFKAWREESKLILVRNAHYFEFDGSNRLPHLDAIAISFIKDRQVAFMEFMSGNFDFLSGLDAKFKEQMLDGEGNLKAEYQGKYRISKQPFLKTDYLGILIDDKLESLNNRPKAIKNIRKAINYGINRQNMVRYLRNNVGRAATSGFVPYGMPSFDNEQVVGFDYDPMKARKLLSEAGFPEGEGLPPIVLATTRDYEDLCEYMQRELQEIGIGVQIEVIDAPVFREMVAESSINAFRNSWVAEYADAENFLSLFYSQNLSASHPDHSDFDSYQYDRLYERAMLQGNDSLRYEIYKQMDRIVLEEAPIIPLYYDEIVRFYQNPVKGVETNAMNMLVLKRARIRS